MGDVVVIALVKFIVTGIIVSAFLVGDSVCVESDRGRVKETGGRRWQQVRSRYVSWISRIR